LIKPDRVDFCCSTACLREALERRFLENIEFHWFVFPFLSAVGPVSSLPEYGDMTCSGPKVALQNNAGAGSGGDSGPCIRSGLTIFLSLNPKLTFDLASYTELSRETAQAPGMQGLDNSRQRNINPDVRIPLTFY